jgi:hypothetical protein
MKMFLVSALALGGLTSAALAGPIALTDAQMDSVTAGQADSTITQTVSQTAESTAAAIGGSATSSVSQTAEQTATSNAVSVVLNGNNNDNSD